MCSERPHCCKLNMWRKSSPVLAMLVAHYSSLSHPEAQHIAAKALPPQRPSPICHKPANKLPSQQCTSLVKKLGEQHPFCGKWSDNLTFNTSGRAAHGLQAAGGSHHASPLTPRRASSHSMSKEEATNSSLTSQSISLPHAGPTSRPAQSGPKNFCRPSVEPRQHRL
jgi:hypothetical protein